MKVYMLKMYVLVTFIFIHYNYIYIIVAVENEIVANLCNLCESGSDSCDDGDTV